MLQYTVRAGGEDVKNVEALPKQLARQVVLAYPRVAHAAIFEGAEGMTDWKRGGMPKDGSIIHVRHIQAYRFKLYKPNSQERKRGKLGRWQISNEYGGWENCPSPEGFEWTDELPSKPTSPESRIFRGVS